MAGPMQQQKEEQKTQLLHAEIQEQQTAPLLEQQEQVQEKKQDAFQQPGDLDGAADAPDMAEPVQQKKLSYKERRRAAKKEAEETYQKKNTFIPGLEVKYQKFHEEMHADAKKLIQEEEEAATAHLSPAMLASRAKYLKEQAARAEAGKKDLETLRTMMNADKTYKPNADPTEPMSGRAHGLLLLVLEKLKGQPDAAEWIARAEMLCRESEEFDKQQMYIHITCNDLPNYYCIKFNRKSVSKDIKAAKDTISSEYGHLQYNRRITDVHAKMCLELMNLLEERLGKDARKQIEHDEVHSVYGDRAKKQMERLRKRHPKLNDDQIRQKLIMNTLNP